MKQRGFIALISAILIASVLFVVVASSSLLGFYTRRTIADGELKARSRAAADACVDVALIALTKDLAYPGQEVRALNSLDSCFVGSIVTLGAQKSFTIQATSSRRAVTNLQIIYFPKTQTVTSWFEV